MTVEEALRIASTATLDLLQNIQQKDPFDPWPLKDPAALRKQALDVLAEEVERLRLNMVTAEATEHRLRVESQSRLELLQVAVSRANRAEADVERLRAENNELRARLDNLYELAHPEDIAGPAEAGREED